ncbi:endoplasmic reticulum-based factor for assembly of V-ATPase [Nitzschia inconspicua]|uniref:Endoplasmic reticulum-based factor for assembly of V-ATPase n=1 Tax=Nitzschia inconspicua TaxID=303405 RepID=A0A9K3M3S6_9STRA|nr:endoplasmic reticulum-based factor for assembly of V-ATPase [Nitzschia inconspicua]
MTSSSASNSFSAKSLEGIQINDSLFQHWMDAFATASNHIIESTASSQSSSTTTTSASSSSTTLTKAMTDLHTMGSPSQGKEKPSHMSLSTLQAIQTIYQEQSNNDRLVSLEEALKTSSLVFSTPKPPSSQSKIDPKFQRRMDRLRLQVEETKYHKLTNNLQDHHQDDDITAKSMTFAASVGLNMIVAPLSFGCFMYFFAGGIFDYFFTGDEFDNNVNNKKPGGTDIKRVIVGVVSGVLMMIIEMLLFVIRTHEMEEHTRRKKKRKGGKVEPFGVYTKNTPAVYSDGTGNKSSRPTPTTGSRPTNDLLQKKQK